MSFFAEAETWIDLPPALKSPALEKAMSVLKEFNTNANWNSIYRALAEIEKLRVALQRAGVDPEAE